MHMDITPYIDNLRRDLVAAADTGDDTLKTAAERLAMALSPAARLALMEAISHAANEITAEMPSGSVEVRLDGRELDFVIDTPMAQPTPPLPPPPPPAAEEAEQDGGVARVTLRLPESVKAKAEERAAEAGQSLNTWLVSVVRSATSEHSINVDIDLSSVPFLGGDPFGRGSGRGKRRMTGWV